MSPRFFVDLPLHLGAYLDLPDAVARHVQVLRLQPGDDITLFNGCGGQFEARIERITRSQVRVQVGTHHPIENEAARVVHLAVGMPANERMDWLIEKATELGVASIQPLMTERSVLRLQGERAQKKQASWRAIASAACEQCRRNQVPVLHPASSLMQWLPACQDTQGHSARLLLSLNAAAPPLATAIHATQANVPIILLSGPEGGLSRTEEDHAQSLGWLPVSLGPRVLRAETAPLAALAHLTLFYEG